MKKRFLYVAEVLFAVATGFAIVYAFFHRDADELVYIIFNSYALIAVALSFAFVLYWQISHKRKVEATKRRFHHLVNNLTSPAMLWDDAMKTVVLNASLLELTALTKRDEGFDPKFVVPWLFGKTEISDQDTKEIVCSKNKEYSFTAKDGTPHDFIWNTSAVQTDDDGNTWFLSIGLDLADIRTMQSELQTYAKRLAASEGRHMLSMELTEIGILLGEQGSQNLFPSKELQVMLGLSGQSITIDELRSRVFPMDLIAFDNHLQAVRQNMWQFVNEVRTLELRLCAADGQYRWFSYRFKAAQKSAGGRLVMGGSIIDITKEKQKDAKMEQIAYEDAVTSIPNRNKLMIMGQELYQCTVELNTSYWVIAMDIDRFHLINDTCGYETGNELLRGFASSMTKMLNLGGFAARISGDNFALILRNAGDDALPERVIGKMQRELASQAVGNFANRSLTCSAGYAQMPRDGENFAQVLEHAEFALSTCKHITGAIRAYTPQMHDSILHDNDIEGKLAEAIRKAEFVLDYQPKILLATGEIVGMEALVRWRQPDGTIVMPSAFLSIAEKSQLISQITRFVLYEACRQAKLWQQMGLPSIAISINMSATDFYQESICTQVLKALENQHLSPQYLELELTELLALKDKEWATLQMARLRDAGIAIAMDDFGTGYSSIASIQELPISMLKLDRSFVMHIAEDVAVQEIVASVVRIAKAKHIATVAEGVETREQEAALIRAGCEYAQGYLYGKPVPARDAELMIRQKGTGRGKTLSSVPAQTREL